MKDECHNNRDGSLTVFLTLYVLDGGIINDRNACLYALIWFWICYVSALRFIVF